MEANLAAFADGPASRSATAAAGRRPRVEDGPDGRRFVVETTDGEYRAEALVVAVGVAEPCTPPGPGHGARPSLRRRPPGRVVRREAGLHHRQAELRVRARERPAAVGPPAGARVAVARPACRSTPGRWSASGPATSSPTRTTSWAAAWRSSTRRSSGSSGAGRRRRARGPPPADRRRRRPGARGRRGHLRDRVRLPLAGPARRSA